MGTARLADFGLMIMTDLSATPLSNTAISSCGTTRWMSPELLDPDRFNSDGLPSRESDCYALGMAIYEVSGFLSFRSFIHSWLGAYRPCTLPSPAVSHSCICDTQRGASEKASESLVSWFY